jgi:TonB family protein
VVGAILVIGIAAWTGERAWAQANGKFVAAEVASAGDVAYPPNTTTTGLVSLLVKLDESGAAHDWQVVQDVPPLTAAAVAGVKQWTFHAATWDGRNVAAYLPVQVVFNPYNPGGTAVPGGGGPKVPPQVPSNLGNWMPPQVRMASYAFYPTNTQAQGTVVLSVEIGKAGHAGNITVVHGVAGLNDAAIEAVKQWGFQPAMRNGETGAGRMCIAFVFQRNLS